MTVLLGQVGMLAPVPPARHHIFLLVTAAAVSARVRTMTVRTAASVVAVVDDDQGILQSLAYLLESADHAVRLFGSAAALLDSGCLAEIDCLISDVDMPGTDGFELVRLVHAARPQLPVVLITGYPDRLMRLPPLAGSPPRVFTKPFQGHELLEAVADALRQAPR
jgi:FixJ family two-component response regulator